MQEKLEEYSREVESENGLSTNSINITPEMLQEYVDSLDKPFMDTEKLRIAKAKKAKLKVKRQMARQSRRINRNK